MVVRQSANVKNAGWSICLGPPVRHQVRSCRDFRNDRTRCLLSVVLLLHSALVVHADDRILDANSVTTAIESIRVEDLKTHVSTLASDAMQSRECGTTGGHAASAYLVQQLRQCGVTPGAAQHQFVQEFSGGMRNVLALLPGRDAQLTDEVVILCAHFDHVGIDHELNLIQ